MLLEELRNQLLSLADLDRNRWHDPAFGQQIAGNAIGQHLGAIARFLLDGRLNRPKGADILLGNQGEDMNRAIDRHSPPGGIAQGGARLLGFIHNDQECAHSCLLRSSYPFKWFRMQALAG